MSPTDPPPDRDPAAERLLGDVFTTDERPVWTARPDARTFARMRPRLVVLGAFWTLVWAGGFTGFALTLLGAEYDGTPRALRLVALLAAAVPFVAVSAYGLGGHVLVLRRAQRRTAYALTDRRVIVRRPALLGALGPPRVRTLPRARVGQVVLDADEPAGPTLEIHDARRVEAPLLLGGVARAEHVRALLARP